MVVVRCWQLPATKGTLIGSSSSISSHHLQANGDRKCIENALCSLKWAMHGADACGTGQWQLCAVQVCPLHCQWVNAKIESTDTLPTVQLHSNKDIMLFVYLFGNHQLMMLLLLPVTYLLRMLMRKDTLHLRTQLTMSFPFLSPLLT